jgi:hypothetical protein
VNGLAGWPAHRARVDLRQTNAIGFWSGVQHRASTGLELTEMLWL